MRGAGLCCNGQQLSGWAKLQLNHSMDCSVRMSALHNTRSCLCDHLCSCTWLLDPAVGLVVDLLCFCIVSHSYRIKYYILRNNVVEKVGCRS